DRCPFRFPSFCDRNLALLVEEVAKDGSTQYHDPCHTGHGTLEHFEPCGPGSPLALGHADFLEQWLVFWPGRVEERTGEFQVVLVEGRLGVVERRRVELLARPYVAAPEGERLLVSIERPGVEL